MERLTLALLLPAVVGASPVAAQESPAKVAEAFFRAVAEERWLDAAREVDVAALDRYRRERIAAARLRPTRPQRPVTVEDLLRQNPDMPRAVAEYQIERIAAAESERFNWVEYEWAGVADIGALAALPAEDAAARWLQARDSRWRTRRALERQRDRGCAVPPDAMKSEPTPAHQVLGTVSVDSTTSYVLFQGKLHRRSDPDVDAAVHSSGPFVLSLRRRGGRWRILPREGIVDGTFGPVLVGVVGPECIPTRRPR